MSHAGIWYVSKYVAPPEGSSVGGRGYELMRELAAMGNECVIITSDANHLARVPEVRQTSLTESRDGLLMVWVRTFKSPAAKSFRRILSWLHFEWRLLRLKKRDLPSPDIVIVSSLSLLTVLNGLVLRWRYRARLVFEVRDIWPLTLTEEGGFSPRHPWVRLLSAVERLGYRFADEVVGTMPNLSSHVEAVLGWRRPVHCIPMGYAERTLRTPEELAPGYLNEHVPTDAFIIAYAGTIGITNALEPFFRAAEIMRADQGVHFLVLGDGLMLDDYKQRFAHVSNLSFAPKVPKGAVQGVLANCDLLHLSVHPSRVWDYGQSLNKVVDYMLSGKPIVASYTGYPSMIDEADCGTYVPAGDADGLVHEFRRYAAMAPRELTEIGENGRAWVLEHRSYRKLAEDYRAILFPRWEGSSAL